MEALQVVLPGEVISSRIVRFERPLPASQAFWKPFELSALSLSRHYALSDFNVKIEVLSLKSTPFF